MDEVGPALWPVTLAGDLMSANVTIEEFAEQQGTTPEVIRVFLQEFCERGWVTPIISLECVSCQETAMTARSLDLPEIVTCRVCGAEQESKDMLSKVHYLPDKQKMLAELGQLSDDESESDHDEDEDDG